MKQKPLKSKPFLKFLTVNELQKLNTNRLLGVLNSIRAIEHKVRRRKMSYGICCNICNSWILGKEEFERVIVPEIAHLTGYKNRVKKILATREHID